MGKQLTVRDVPDEVRNELAARAARAGQSMQEYLRGELIRLASKPSLAEWVARVRQTKGHAEGARVDDVLTARGQDRR